MEIGSQLDAATVAVGAAASAPTTAAAWLSIPSASLPAGNYRVWGSYQLSGTAETALANNRLRKGTTSLATPLPTISAGGLQTFELPRVALDGASSLNMIVIANATAGAVYSGVLHAQRVE